MDIFYKPPMQRAAECKSLEENYMNCLLQKSLKDKVFVNRCVLDSVLWFHLECPRAASKFDDPIEFKRKFRDFFAHNKSILEATSYKTASYKRMNEKFGYQTAYPEDLQESKRVVKFADEFEKFSPMTTPVDLDEEDPNEGQMFNKEIAPQDRLYGKKIEWLQANPITLNESKVAMDEMAKEAQKTNAE